MNLSACSVKQQFPKYFTSHTPGCIEQGQTESFDRSGL